jgi:ribonuclease HI
MRACSTMTRLHNKPFKIILGSASMPHERCHLLQFDGGSNPNPGPSSAGAVIFSPGQRTFVYEQGVFIPHASSNEAEYKALLVGLEAAKGLGIKHLLIEGDSQLVVEQVAGSYKMKSETLRPFFTSVKKLLAKDFEFVGIRHIYRENNTYADGITKYILQTKRSYIEEMASARSHSSSAC